MKPLSEALLNLHLTMKSNIVDPNDPFSYILHGSTGSAGSTHPTSISLADLEKSVKSLESVQRNKEWILIDPQGNAWKSENVMLLAAKLMSQTKFDPLPYNMAQTLHDNLDELYEK